MSLLNPLATALSKVFSAGARPSAEYAFSQLQNSYIRRRNTEIIQVNESSGDLARELELKRSNKQLGAQIVQVQQYTFDNQSNLGKLGELGTLVSDLAGIFASDGNATDVTAQEATDFVTKRDEVVEKMNSLRVLSYPDVANDGRVRDLLDQIATLQTYTPDVGAIDPSGTENPNNNRVIEDFVADLTNKVAVALTVSQDTVHLGNHMHEVALQKYTENEAELVQMTEIDQADRIQEIEDLKVEYANLLKAASLASETALYYTENIAKNLNGFGRPAPGSVLNMFS